MQNYSLITSLVTGFGLALPFGYLAERFLRSPALVGYILAGSRHYSGAAACERSHD